MRLTEEEKDVIVEAMVDDIINKFREVTRSLKDSYEAIGVFHFFELLHRALSRACSILLIAVFQQALENIRPADNRDDQSNN